MKVTDGVVGLGGGGAGDALGQGAAGFGDPEQKRLLGVIGQVALVGADLGEVADGSHDAVAGHHLLDEERHDALYHGHVRALLATIETI